MSKQATIKEGAVEGLSKEAADFANKCLLRKPFKRLGYKGINELKNHAWFAGFDWTELMKKNGKPPYVPKKEDNFDKVYNNAEEKPGLATKERYQKIYRDDLHRKEFREFHNFVATVGKEQLKEEKGKLVIKPLANKMLSSYPKLNRNVSVSLHKSKHSSAASSMMISAKSTNTISTRKKNKSVSARG